MSGELGRCRSGFLSVNASTYAFMLCKVEGLNLHDICKSRVSKRVFCNERINCRDVSPVTPRDGLLSRTKMKRAKLLLLQKFGATLHGEKQYA